MQKKDSADTVALVLGGHINGYSIIKELVQQGNRPSIALFDYAPSIARYSNRVTYHDVISKEADSLLVAINKLHEQFGFIVIYPTDDLQLENLHSIYDDINDFCFIPFNQSNLLRTSDKAVQYAVCEEVGVPYPKSIELKVDSEFDNAKKLTFPLLIKPTIRKDLTVKVFRNIYIENELQLESHRAEISNFFQKGVQFLVSEFVPGDDTNIYAYTCFRSPTGNILNEWVGKKLTQYPDNYGVFCSASNEAPDEVKRLGALLVNELDAYGIVEPEFKFDCRDKQYKLMEVNLRSMMWHYTGNISGVKLHETQLNYAMGKDVYSYTQNKSVRTHFVLMLHEIPNLIARKGYWKHFKYNIFNAQKRTWAVFDSSDIKPFLFSLYPLTKLVISACLRRLKLR